VIESVSLPSVQIGTIENLNLEQDREMQSMIRYGASALNRDIAERVCNGQN
jgi:hypothetical protein